MREALLQLQVFVDRHLAPDLRARGDFAVLGLEQREEPDSTASRASLIVSSGAEPQPSGHGTKMWM